MKEIDELKEYMKKKGDGKKKILKYFLKISQVKSKSVWISHEPKRKAFVSRAKTMRPLLTIEIIPDELASGGVAFCELRHKDAGCLCQ